MDSHGLQWPFYFSANRGILTSTSHDLPWPPIAFTSLSHIHYCHCSSQSILTSTSHGLPWPPIASSLLSVTYNVQTPPPMDSNSHFSSQPTQVSLPPPPMASHGLQPSYCNIQCTSYIGDSSLGMVPLVSQGVVPLACGIIPHLLHLLTRGLVPDPQGMKGVVPLPGVIPHW